MRDISSQLCSLCQQTILLEKFAICGGKGSPLLSIVDHDATQQAQFDTALGRGGKPAAVGKVNDTNKKGRRGARSPPPIPLQGAHVLHKGGNCAPRAGRCPPRGWQQGHDQSTAHGTVHVVRRCETLERGGGAGGWDRRGCATGAPRSANRQGEEQHRHTERGSHTRRDKAEHNKQGGGAQQGWRGNQNSGNREPEWSGWRSVRMGGSDNKGDGLASQPRR